LTSNGHRLDKGVEQHGPGRSIWDRQSRAQRVSERVARPVSEAILPGQTIVRKRGGTNRGKIIAGAVGDREYGGIELCSFHSARRRARREKGEKGTENPHQQVAFRKFVKNRLHGEGKTFGVLGGVRE